MQPKETAFTVRFSFSGTSRRNSSTSRTLMAMKVTSKVRCGSKPLGGAPSTPAPVAPVNVSVAQARAHP